MNPNQATVSYLKFFGKIFLFDKKLGFVLILIKSACGILFDV
jgi:hypothetical protein